MNIDDLEKSLIDPLTKNLPSIEGELHRDKIAAQHWNILREDLPLPLAVLRQSKILNNAKWMQNFLSKTGVSIAPHGKTTMSPQLFKIQMDTGAWGITIATLQQLRVCRHFGIDRILMANQLMGRKAIRSVLNELKRDPNFEFYCIVDSVAHVKMLLKEAREVNVGRPLNLLIEMGVEGKRTGCRSIDTAFEVAKAVNHSFPLLALCGVECFEGVLVSDDPHQDAENVSHLLDKSFELVKKCQEHKFFNTDTIIMSAGGSAYFDIVSRQWSEKLLAKNIKVVLRSGCYLTHDSVFYQRLFSLLEERVSQTESLSGQLEPALEVWAYVQSRPEKNLAILNLGKRDCSYDIDLPVPKLWFNSNQHKRPEIISHEDYHIFKLDDQHGYMRIPVSSEMKVGDLIGCRISHPCTTFDKWRELFLVDDNYNVVSMIKTFF